MENKKNAVTYGEPATYNDPKDEETTLVQAEPSSGSFVEDFKRSVKNLLIDSGTKARNFLIEEEAEAILQTRKMAAKKAYQTLLASQKELKKLIPDNERYDANGKLVSADYTKNQAKKIVDLKKEISDTETLLKNAFDKNDFDKLVEKYGKA